MSEIAMVSVRKARLDGAAKKGDLRAKRALELANEPAKFLSGVLFGVHQRRASKAQVTGAG